MHLLTGKLLENNSRHVRSFIWLAYRRNINSNGDGDGNINTNSKQEVQFMSIDGDGYREWKTVMWSTVMRCLQFDFPLVYEFFFESDERRKSL